MAGLNDCVPPPQKKKELELDSEKPSADELNGLHKPPQGEHDAREQEEDHISQQISENQDAALMPMKEDLSEWITRLTGQDINADTFMDVLDSGVVLCKIAELITKQAQEMAAQGKLTEPLPNCKLKYNSRPNLGKWFARDNVATFLQWCRAYGMSDEATFVSEDLVSHRQEKSVVSCVLELARVAWKFGIEPPSLIRMEKEIDKEDKEPPPTPPPFEPKPVEVVVKARPPSPPASARKPAAEIADLDKEVRRLAIKCKCLDYVKKIKEGVYNIFGRRVFIRLLQHRHLMVRVGGGWSTLEHYLLHHDPMTVHHYHYSDRPDLLDGEKYLVIKSRYKSSSSASASASTTS